MLLILCLLIMLSFNQNIVNVATLNVKGLLNVNSQFTLKQFCFSHNVDILFLQETHVHNLKIAKTLDTYFDHFKCFWNFGTNLSRGTAIFISHSLDFSVVKYHRDLDGRFQFVDVLIDGIPFRLINIYAPNNNVLRKEFFDDIYPFIMSKNMKILGGDFNCIDNPSIDKKGGNIEKGTYGCSKIKNIVTDFELFDVYRFLYPDKVNTTWYGKDVACRLDRIYLSSSLDNCIKSCDNFPFAYSDHDCVLVSFVNNTEVKKGNGYWHLNNSILNDNVFCIKFREWFINLTDGLDICLEMWDFFKEQIKEFCIDYCRKKNKVKFKVIKELEKKYFILLNEEKNSPGEFFDQVKEIKEQIKQFHLDNFKGAQIRSKVRNLNNAENPSKYFFQKEVTKGKKKSVTEIRNGDVVYTKQCDIIKQFENFYTDLFTEEEIDDDICNFFIDNLPMLDDTDKDVCDSDITLDEIYDSVKSMENDKSPGPDGLSKNFYMRFFDILGPMLLKLYENIFEENSLSNSQKVSYITLICKDLNKHYDVKAYRPISLMNYDVKILSKLICKRMSSVCDKLINLDQTCAIPYRSILDNAHLLRNIYDYVNQKNLQCSFISLDQEKAFDRVNHKFLFRVLEKYNFGENLIKWIKILYNELSSCILVNNFISSPVKITRSVKQGCSLSPLLYVLCLEPFARKVREDNEIVGVHLPGSPDTCKISLFADDSTGILTTDKGIHKFLYLIDLFGKGSGSKLNKAKTKGIWLGAWKYRKDNYRFGINFVDCIKIVGIKFGNVTEDDVWSTIFVKFEKELENYKYRKLSLLEKAIIINVVACSKLWYVGTILPMSKFYINKFQRAMFSFLWNSKSEPLNRNTLYLDKLSGGLNIVNIEMKLKSLRLKHVQDIVNNRDVKFKYLSVYWIGLSLRHYNKELCSMLVPHSDTVSPFYTCCLEILKLYKDKCPDSNVTLGGITTKKFYSTLMSDDKYKIKVVQRFPLTDYNSVFKRVFNKFVDKFSRDVIYRIVHQILPVNCLMFKYNISKSNKCTFCNSVETIGHLFIECDFISQLYLLLKNWILSLSNGALIFSNKHIFFEDIDHPNSRTLSTILLLIALYCKTIWLKRNDKKFTVKKVTREGVYMNFLYQLKLRILADYDRFPRLKFVEYWCDTDLFCTIDDNDELKINFL